MTRKDEGPSAPTPGPSYPKLTQGLDVEMTTTGKVTDQLTPARASLGAIQSFKINGKSTFHDIGTFDHAESTLAAVSGLVSVLGFGANGIALANESIAESAFDAIGTLIDLAAFSLNHALAAKEV